MFDSMWLWAIIIAAIIGCLIGYFSSKDGERGGSAVSGAVTGGMGCAYLLFQLFCWGVGIMLMLWLFSAMFG